METIILIGGRANGAIVGGAQSSGPGTPGAQGPQGPQGPAGAAGAPGKSAYALAVEDGYTGTEAQWLSLLMDGTPGPPGKSAYQTAVEAGYLGTETEWVAMLMEGTAGSALTDFWAGEALGGHRVVYLDNATALTASPVLDQADRVVGVTNQSAIAGASVQVRRRGVMEEPTWSWQEGPVYLGPNGILTQSAPTTGVLLQVGVALSATALDVRISVPLEIE